MTVRGLPPRVFYTAYNKDSQLFVPNDEANHTLTFRRDGTNFTPTNPPTHVANGVYEVVLTDAERVGELLVVTGASSTGNVLLEPYQFAADPRLAGMTEPDPEDAALAQFTLVSATQIISAIVTHGDGAGAWGAVAVGFATPGDVAASTAAILEEGGDGPWTQTPASTGDWTDAEKKQFRYQIGIDGLSEAPSTAVPNLSTFNPGTQRVLANLVSILGSDQRANQHAMNIDSLVPTTVDSTNLTPSATEFDTPLTAPADDHYKNRAVLFLDGPNQYAASHVTGYTLVGGKGRLTVAGFPQAPSAGNILIII